MKTFITLLLVIISASAFSQTVLVTETFPSTEFNNSGSGGQSGVFNGDLSGWSFSASASSIIEVDNAPDNGKTKGLRLASGSGSNNNPRTNTATSPRISLSGSSCPISEYDFTFEWLVEDGAGSNYEVNLQFSGDGGNTWQTVWTNTNLPSEGNWRTVTVSGGIPNLNSYWEGSDFRYRFTTRRASGSSFREIWIDNIRILASYSGTTIPTFSALPILVQGVHLQPGAVYLYDNVVTAPETLDALIRIEKDSNAHVTLLDNNIPNPGRFQPKIANDGVLGNGSETSDRGWVQFSITFIKNNSYKENSLFTDDDDDFVAQALTGLRYQHYDVDGFFNGSEAAGGYFRETGAISSPMSILVNNPTDITSGGVVKADGYDWHVMKGEIAEHDGISSDLDVTFTATFGPSSVIRFRLGFEYVRGNGGSVTADREYATEFNCLSYPQQATLPVRLISFNGSYRNQATYLNWETDSEVNFDHFEIERSLNGTNFITVGSKESASTTQSGRQMYNYMDNLAGENSTVFYYRLKMVDKDAQYKYSNVIMIRTESRTINGVAINPNPVANGMATVRFTSEGNNIVTMKVIDMTGKVVLQQHERVYSGNNSVSLNNLNRLQPGTYVLQMMNEDEISTIKFSIAR